MSIGMRDQDGDGVASALHVVMRTTPGRLKPAVRGPSAVLADRAHRALLDGELRAFELVLGRRLLRDVVVIFLRSGWKISGANSKQVVQIAYVLST